MHKVSEFLIEFDKDASIYQAGELVTGRATFRTDRDVTCDVVKAHFYGSARTEWSENELRNDYYGPVIYRQEDIFFDESQVLWAVEKDDQKLDSSTDITGILKAGKHAWEFNYRLPQKKLATSFNPENSIGKIEYFVKIAVWQRDCITLQSKAVFGVIWPENLNLNRKLAEPVALDFHRDITSKALFIPVGKQSIAARLTLEKTGFVPGEAIKLSLEVSNDNNRKTIKVVKAALLQMVQCVATTPEYRTKNCGATKVAGFCRTVKVLPQKSFLLDNEVIMVPAVVPSLTDSDVIIITYVLEIALYTSSGAARIGPMANMGIPPALIFQTPVEIGTVPLATTTAEGYYSLN